MDTVGGVSSTCARPGLLLRGAAATGLVTWAGLLFVLAMLPGIEAYTFLSALAMACFFAAIVAIQNASEIRAGQDGLVARSFLRSLACGWKGVARPRSIRTIPGVSTWIVATHAGTVVFSSLWKNHRRLVEEIERRATH